MLPKSPQPVSWPPGSPDPRRDGSVPRPGPVLTANPSGALRRKTGVWSRPGPDIPPRLMKSGPLPRNRTFQNDVIRPRTSLAYRAQCAEQGDAGLRRGLRPSRFADRAEQDSHIIIAEGHI